MPTAKRSSARRARVVAAADDGRRRIERDLHDGVQQRLVSLGLELRNAQATLPEGVPELHSQLERIVQGMTSAFDELRAISPGSIRRSSPWAVLDLRSGRSRDALRFRSSST
jgi:signal transduction histidine kinase